MSVQEFHDKEEWDFFSFNFLLNFFFFFFFGRGRFLNDFQYMEKERCCSQKVYEVMMVNYKDGC